MSLVSDEFIPIGDVERHEEEDAPQTAFNKKIPIVIPWSYPVGEPLHDNSLPRCDKFRRMVHIGGDRPPESYRACCYYHQYNGVEFMLSRNLFAASAKYRKIGDEELNEH